ncbi:hypothetical protein PVAND_010416 [Polypedilum vanderplanki]|uniref:Uncharacterized protein n=1 Tax=Polypedilum vanderplanki TaxID=319348 RepID=A0A9J6CFV0_POLVA|nr:hypothetical protein PVAND_010416 [Polypedilum vanderplanki]
MTSTFLIIYVFHRSPQWIKEKVFGKNISHPGYNALGIFFGIPQFRIPRESFSRFLLIMFILFCLIIRTCYQSMMFEFMTSDMQKPLPESIEDLTKMNYIVVIAESLVYLVTKQLKERKLKNFFVVHSEEALFDLYRYALFPDPKLKFAFPGTTQEVLKIITKNEKLELYASLTLPRNHIMIIHMSEILERYITAGIAKYHYEYSEWFDNILNAEKEVDTRRILSLGDLEYGFVFYMAVSFVAI